MRTKLILFSLFFAVSCGKKTETKYVEVEKVLPIVKTLEFQGSRSSLQGLTVTIDLDKLNQTVDVSELTSLVCNKSVKPNQVTIVSMDGGFSGIISFSELGYGDNSGYNSASDSCDARCLADCRVFNNERYIFNYDGETLTLKADAKGKSWDLVESIFQ